MRILSYNVRYFSQRLRGLASTRGGLRAIAAAVAELAPDIICLQEVESRSLRSRSRELQLDAFVRALGLPHQARYFPVHALGGLYTTGLAILVDPRFAIAAEHTLPLTSAGDGGERRACAHLELRENGQSLHIFNVHLSLPSWFKGFGHGENQLRQTLRLATLVREHAGASPFIVGGDFNSRPSSPVHRQLSSSWSAASTDLSPSAGIGPLRVRLDYLFGGNGVRWMETPPLGDRFHGLSDHLPQIGHFA